MPVSKDERNRILHLIEEGQVTAQEAAQLLDALEVEYERRIEPGRERIVRIRTTNVNPKLKKVHMTASLPVSLLRVSLRMGAKIFPQYNTNLLEDLLRTIESGAAGRLLDMQDLEKGERIEIFVE